MQWQDKVIWVTGASSGLGLQLATDLAKRGNHVIASGRNRQAILALQQRFPNLVECLDFDATQAAHWESVPGRLKQLTDSLDAIFMVAGVCEYIDTIPTNLSVYRRVFEVNFFAAVQTVHCALPLLRASEWQSAKRWSPCIIGIGSLSAHLPLTRAEAYGASKAAFEYWLHSLRIDLQPENIAVSVVSPGFVDTPLTQKNDFAMPFLLTAEEASARILKKTEQLPYFYAFPKRLWCLIRLMASCKVVWYRWLAAKLRKNSHLL